MSETLRRFLIGDALAAAPGAALPLRPRPIPEEAAIGYLIRLSALYGYESPRALHLAIAQRFGSCRNVLRDHLLIAADEWRTIQGPWPSYCLADDSLPSGLERGDFTHSVMRWCPLCLRESVHLRFAWTVKLVCWCPRHQVMLVDTCPQCGCVQRLDRVDLGRCRCGMRLLDVATSDGSAALSLVQRSLLSALHSGRSSTGLDVPLHGWMRMLRKADRVVNVCRSRKTGQVAGLDFVHGAVKQSEALGSLLVDWPTGFQHFLRGCLLKECDSFSIPRTYGPIYRWIYGYLREDCFQFLRDAFEDHLRDNWWGLISGRNRNVCRTVRDTHKRVTVSAVATAAGTHASTVRQMHLAGLIQASVVRLPSGRHSWSIPIDELEVIKRHVGEGANLQVAARILSIPKSRVHELIDAGLLTAALPSSGGVRAWMFSRVDIENLLASCLPSEHRVLVPDSPVELRQVLKCWRLQPGEFPELVRAIQRGEVRIAGHSEAGTGLGGLMLSKNSALAWRSTREGSVRGSLSIDGAAHLIGVKQQVAYELVRTGMLKATPVKGTNKVRRVCRLDVSEFIQRYVSLAELAVTLGRSPRALLRDINVEPVCGPGVNGVRQYFFRRSDLMPVDAKCGRGALPTDQAVTTR